MEFFMSRKLINLLSLTVISTIVLSLSGCLEQYYQTFSLSIQARGLASNETITVSNGSSLEITGNSDLTWTESQRFSKGYRGDRTDYSVSISRQPSNSNKMCRVLNPAGTVNDATNLVRIECGYPIVVSDVIDDITGLGTMNTSNGLMVSNGLQTLALNSSRSLVTRLDHLVVNDPDPDSNPETNPDNKKLQIEAVTSNGAVIFTKLYLEGDAINISHTSVDQGCEIGGADLDSTLNLSFPSNESFMPTVQTIPLANDWIDPSDDLSAGRSCANFKAGTLSFLDYAYEEENTNNESAYSAICFPNEPIEITCGFALKVTVTGLDTNTDESVIITATKNTSLTHSITIDRNNTAHTFNLAFNNAGTDTYSITANDSGTLKSCTFDSSGSLIAPLVPPSSVSNNTTEVLRCI